MDETLRQIQRALVETMSPKAIPQQHVPAVVQIMRALAKGKPLSVTQVADVTDKSESEAREVMGKLAAVGMLESDDIGNVVGMIISLTPTPHRLRVNETVLHTWCAIDTLFVPAVLRKTGYVESICPHTGETIRTSSPRRPLLKKQTAIPGHQPRLSG